LIDRRYGIGAMTLDKFRTPGILALECNVRQRMTALFGHRLPAARPAFAPGAHHDLFKYLN
jgi:hypothetical protein